MQSISGLAGHGNRIYYNDFTVGVSGRESVLWGDRRHACAPFLGGAQMAAACCAPLPSTHGSLLLSRPSSAGVIKSIDSTNFNDEVLVATNVYPVE